MIDLSELLEESVQTVPVGGGKVWRLYPPTAWDRLRLEQHLQDLTKSPSMPSDAVWNDVRDIVLNAGPRPGGVERAAHELPVEVSVPLVWWGWLRWCRGEDVADSWVKSLGKAMVAHMATVLTSPTTRRGSTSTGSVSEIRSPASTSPTGFPQRPTDASATNHDQEKAPAGATSSPISVS